MKHLLTLFLLLSFVNGYSQKADTSEVYFELNIAKVSTIASMSLDSLWYSKVLSSGRKTTLLGYGDYLGTDEYNLSLSENRAKNVKDYLVALGLDENNIVACKGKGRIVRSPIPGQLGYYKDRKVMIITERIAKKMAKPVPEPKKVSPPKPAIVKQEEPKPQPVKQEVVKVEPPKPAPAKQPEPPKPVPAPAKPTPPAPPAKGQEVKRKPEKDLATLDPAKLLVDEVIPLNNIFFAPGSNAMLRKSQPALEQLFKFLDDNKNISVEIEGHICFLDPADGTDEPDGLGGNRSEGRAKNIYIYLVSKGVDRNRMKFTGLGNKKPAVFPERTEFDRELNRRATIRITAK